MTSSATPLLSLPPELILEIARKLPPDGKVALSYTHPRLHGTLLLLPRERNAGLSDCAHFAIRTYQESPRANTSHARCIRCKASYPTALFFSSSSPSCIAPPNGQDQEVIALPKRVCAWHVRGFTRVIRTESGGKNEWVANDNNMCMHCGAVKEWKPCDCNCDSCWFKPVTTYTRFLNNDEEYKDAWFIKKASSASPPASDERSLLFVRETCYKHTKPEGI